MRFDVCPIKIGKLENSVGPEPMDTVRLDSIEVEEEDEEGMEKQDTTNTNGHTC